MANRIVRDSQLAIFVKDVIVAAANADPATVPVINDVVAIGNIIGLVGDTPQLRDQGWATTVDTAAEVRIANVAVAATQGQTVYRNTSTGVITVTATSSVAIGYATHAKASASAGDLWVQLVPKAA